MLTYYQMSKIWGIIATQAGHKYGISPSLILAISKTESGGEYPYVSKDNRYGLMGVTEEMIQDSQKNTDGEIEDINAIYLQPYYGFKVGAWWFQQLLAMFSEDDAIRAYSVGIQLAKTKIDTGIKYLHQVRKHETEFKKLETQHK